MKRRILRGWQAAFVVLAFALLSLGIWRGEVEWIKGWAGLNWLAGYPWAALPICVLVAASILVSVVAAAPASAWVENATRGERQISVLFLAIVSAVSWLSFEIARRWFETNPFWGTFTRPAMTAIAGWLAWPIGSIAFCAVAIFLAIDRLLLRLRRWTIALFVAALALVLPASWLLLQLVPAHGYRDSIHSIKAGYPPLWTNLLMGAVAGIAARFGQRRERRAPHRYARGLDDLSGGGRHNGSQLILGAVNRPLVSKARHGSET